MTATKTAGFTMIMSTDRPLTRRALLSLADHPKVDCPVAIMIATGRAQPFTFEVGDRVWRRVDPMDPDSEIRTGTVVLLYQRTNTRFGIYTVEYAVQWDDGEFYWGVLDHGISRIAGALPAGGGQ